MKSLKLDLSMENDFKRLLRPFLVFLRTTLYLDAALTDLGGGRCIMIHYT